MGNFIKTDISIHGDSEDGTEVERKRQAPSGSFIAMLEGLEVGHTATKCKQITGHKLYDAASLAAERRALHNSVGPQVNRLAARSGRDFKVEVVDLFSGSSARLFVVAFVTRTA